MDARDPGWRAALRAGLAPAAALRRRDQDAGTLATLRIIFVTVAVALCLLAFVLHLILESWTGPAGAVAALPFLAGTAGLVAAAWSRARALPCGSPQELAAAYRARTFLGIAGAEAGALAGFVAAIVADAGWPYLVGLAFAAAGLALAAPTAADVARRQQRLRAAACDADLLSALTEARGSS